jgi:pimeloyl-ACP methyl ester carboxylesterase
MSIVAIVFSRSPWRATPVIVIATALVLAGCAAQPRLLMPAHAQPFGQYVTLIYVPGIGGYGNDDGDWIRGLKAGGYSGKAEVWEWTGKLASIPALWAHTRQRAQARQIAERVRKLRVDSPSEQIVLVGHSAGTGLVVMALEDLPPDSQVDEVVLLAPAISRNYDLTPALQHVHGHADVFCSERDTLILAIGTFLFGTVDGVHGEAAGHGGFIKPRRASDGAYAKLTLHPFSNDRQLYGDDGGHEGILAPGIAASLVAPLLPGHEIHHETVAQVDTYELR